MTNTNHHFKQVRKRDGNLADFDQNKITTAIAKAMRAAEEGDALHDAEKVSDQVVSALVLRYPEEYIPSIEEVQDIAEEQLIAANFSKTAKHYILYRNERAKVREKQRQVPELA